jgi:DNA-binding NarL/FixJ family response regulator
MTTQLPQTTDRSPARLFVFDRHPLTRQGLQELFEGEGFEVLGGAEEPESAVTQILALRPDVCILDIGVPAGTGIEVCRRVHKAAPSIGCVMLAGWQTPAIARAAAEAGAKALVLKNVDTAELLAVVTAVANPVRARLPRST